MKKALALVLAVILAGGIYVTVFASRIMRSARNADVTEEVFFGDRTLLDGMRLEYDTEFSRGYQGGLLSAALGSAYVWENSLGFSKDTFSFGSELSFRLDRQAPSADERMSFQTTLKVPYDKMREVIEKYQDGLSDETVSLELTIPAEEVFDTYPLQIMIDHDNTAVSVGKRYETAELRSALDEYFRITVPEDLMVKVTMTRERLTRVDFNGFGEDRQYLPGYVFGEESFSVPLNGGSCLRYKDSLYFYINLRNPVRQGVQYRAYENVPGGYGVYKLDTGTKDGSYCIDPASLDTLCSFGEGSVIRALQGSDKGDILNVFVSEERSVIIYSFDTGSKELKKKQEIPLDDTAVQFLQDGEGYFLIGTGNISGDGCADGKILLYTEDEKGLPSLEMTADLTKLTDNGTAVYRYVSRDCCFSWSEKCLSAYRDGRLYLVWDEFVPSDTPIYAVPSVNGISVAVFGKGGPLYFGNYKSSLDSPARHSYYSTPVLSFH